MYSDMDQTALPFSEASERNKAPILEALLPRLPARGRVLEVASGTGQHVVHFAPAFPRLSWQPSEQRENLESLNARIRLQGCARILPAIELDVSRAWPDHLYDAAYSANTAHIMSWDLVECLFAGLAPRLAPTRPFCLYGPFIVRGRHTSASNEVFDRQLRLRDPFMGLRDVDDLIGLAGRCGLRLEERLQLPANNQLLVFRRQEEAWCS